ncbi:OmcA/MtrC family decaheme c-type cytochrome [Trichloromonas acetexigens]|nr:OmcA/MtrC family decaheme c-type cytochrome [Desulfuromonas acetexigens]
MYRRMLVLLVALFCSSIMLWGCGSSGGGGSSVSVPVEDDSAAVNDPTPTVPVNSAVARTNWAVVPQLDIADATVADDGKLTVNFTLADQSGAPLTGLTGFSFIAAQLVPSGDLISGAQDAQDPFFWQSYINRVEDASAAGTSGGQPNNVGPGGAPVYEKAIQATTESNGTLVDNGNGSYSYTFSTNLKTGTFFPVDPATMTYAFLGDTALAFDANRTHRVAIQFSGVTPAERAPVNAFYDFIPATGLAIDPAVDASRLVAETASCNACHDGRLALHGGNRTEVGYCVTCHNPGTVDANSGFNLDMANMVHKIHRGQNLPSVKAGDEYAIWGYRGTEHNYSEVVYPSLYYGSTAEPLNCTACHTSTASTPDGDNWYTKTSDLACFSCHDQLEVGKEFAYHAGGTYDRHDQTAGSDPYPADQANIDARNCGGCHTGTATDLPRLYRRTFYAHSHDFARPQFRYVIESVSVNANRQPVIRFRVQQRANAGAAFADMDLLAQLPEYTPVYGGAAVRLSSGPNFALIYSTTGTDWDLNRPNGQPASASLANLGAGTKDGAGTGSGSAGTLVANGDGSFTATVTGGSYPAGATRRAVFMQGYFQLGTARLDTPSPLTFVDGDTARREIVEQDKCLGCHGGIGFHGGNRVDNPLVCAGCHNPRLTSSGHTLPDGQPEDEVSNNLKDMIHGIHGGTLVGVRNFNGNATAYDFTTIMYPGVLSNCLSCHKEGTFGQPATGTAVTTNVTLDRTAAEAGADDLVTSPYSASCVGCHNSTEAIAHFRDFNGSVRAKRSDVVGGEERCALCHSISNPVEPVDGVHSGLQ